MTTPQTGTLTRMQMVTESGTVLLKFVRTQLDFEPATPKTWSEPPPPHEHHAFQDP